MSERGLAREQDLHVHVSYRPYSIAHPNPFPSHKIMQNFSVYRSSLKLPL